MDVIKLSQGADLDWLITLRDTDDEPILDTYDGTETPSFDVWAGDARAELTLANSTLAWATPAAGTLTLHLDRLDTTGIGAGTYQVRCRILDGPDLVDVYEAELVVTATAGADAAEPVYATLSDLRRYCDWIEAVQAKGDQSGFAEQLAEAREWWDDLLHRHDRGGGQAAYAGDYRGRGLAVGFHGRRSRWLAEQLAADRLILTRPVIKCVAHYALWLILKNKIGSKGKTSYQDLAADCLAEAEDGAKLITAELDTDGDGYGDYPIDLGTVPTWRA